MTERWSKIIDSLFYMKPEAIDKQKLRLSLSTDYAVDEQVIDNLYIIGVLSLDEYKVQMEKVTKQHERYLDGCKERLRLAEEKGKDFDPMIFYGVNSPNFGQGLNSEKETKWSIGGFLNRILEQTES